MAAGTDPQDIYHNGRWYSRFGGEVVPNTQTSTNQQLCGLMGDSIASLNLEIADYNVGAANEYRTVNQNVKGWLNCANMRLGQVFYVPLSNQFAVAGTTTDVIIANQLPNVLASHASRPIKRVFISCGTNDANGGATLAEMREDFHRLFGTLMDAGIIPVHIGCLPRGSGSGDANINRAMLDMNRWMEEYTTRYPGFEFLNLGETLCDPTSAYGLPVAAFMDASYLHPVDPGGWWMGKAMADYYTAQGITRTPKYAYSVVDVYNATYNPHGILGPTPNALLSGGTTQPTNMLTSGGTWSKTTRTLDNGQTRDVRTCVTAASTLHYLYDDYVNGAAEAWDASDQIVAGDYVVCVARVKITDLVNATSVALRITEANGSGTVALNYNGSNAVGKALPTSLPGALTLDYQTAPIRIRGYQPSGTPALSMRMDCVIDAGGSGTFEVQALEMRRWDGPV